MRKFIMTAMAAALLFAAGSSQAGAQQPGNLGPGFGMLPNNAAYSPFGPGFGYLNNGMNSYPASTWQYGNYQPYYRSYYTPSYGYGGFYNRAGNQFGGGTWINPNAPMWGGVNHNRHYHR